MVDSSEPLNLSALEKTTHSLAQSLQVFDHYAENAPDDLKQTLQAGVIQNFEFTYEVSWKFLKRWLAENLGKSAVEDISRRELFRLATEHQLIESVTLWMHFHRARNETSNTYDLQVTIEVFEVAEKFSPVAIQLLNTLQQKA